MAHKKPNRKNDVKNLHSYWTYPDRYIFRAFLTCKVSIFYFNTKFKQYLIFLGSDSNQMNS